MSGRQRAAINELVAVLGNDALRGGANRELLVVRRAAVEDAAAAREPFAYRQALLELAACALGLAARLPAPAAPVPRVTRVREQRDDPPPTGPRAGSGHAVRARRAA